MKGVIYARYSSDNQREEVLRGSCENVRIMQNETVSRF